MYTMKFIFWLSVALTPSVYQWDYKSHNFWNSIYTCVCWVCFSSFVRWEFQFSIMLFKLTEEEETIETSLKKTDNKSCPSFSCICQTLKPSDCWWDHNLKKGIQIECTEPSNKENRDIWGGGWDKILPTEDLWKSNSSRFLPKLELNIEEAEFK